MQRGGHVYDLGSASSRPAESSSDGPAGDDALEGFYASAEEQFSSSQPSRFSSEMVLNPVYLEADMRGDREPTQRWAAATRVPKDAAATDRNNDDGRAAPSPWALTVKRGSGATGWTRLHWGLFVVVALVAIAALALNLRNSSGNSSDAGASAATTGALRTDYYTRRVRVRGRWGGRYRQGPMTQGAARAGGRGGGAAGKGPAGQGGGRRQGRTTRSRQGRRGESGAARRRDGARGAAGRATPGSGRRGSGERKGGREWAHVCRPNGVPPPRAGPAPALRGVAAAP